MKSKVHPRYKTKYRVANWPAYNQALVRRGDVTVWLSSEAITAWTPCASRIPNSLAESRIEATLRGVWRLASSNEVRSHASLKGHTPLTFAGGHMVARAELNNVR